MSFWMISRSRKLRYFIRLLCCGVVQMRFFWIPTSCNSEELEFLLLLRFFKFSNGNPQAKRTTFTVSPPLSYYIPMENTFSKNYFSISKIFNTPFPPSIKVCQHIAPMLVGGITPYWALVLPALNTFLLEVPPTPRHKLLDHAWHSRTLKFGLQLWYNLTKQILEKKITSKSNQINILFGKSHIRKA